MVVPCMLAPSPACSLNHISSFSGIPYSDSFRPDTALNWPDQRGNAHYAWTGKEEAILQVQFIGPGGIDYVNPADDPRKK